MRRALTLTSAPLSPTPEKARTQASSSAPSVVRFSRAMRILRPESSPPLARRSATTAVSRIIASADAATPKARRNERHQSFFAEPVSPIFTIWGIVLRQSGTAAFPRDFFFLKNIFAEQ